MKMFAHDYYDREDGYEIYYRTAKQLCVKFRWFANLIEARTWLLSRKRKINIVSGSWQLLDLYETLCDT